MTKYNIGTILYIIFLIQRALTDFYLAICGLSIHLFIHWNFNSYDVLIAIINAILLIGQFKVGSMF